MHWVKLGAPQVPKTTIFLLLYRVPASSQNWLLPHRAKATCLLTPGSSSFLPEGPIGHLLNSHWPNLSQVPVYTNQQKQKTCPTHTAFKDKI